MKVTHHDDGATSMDTAALSLLLGRTRWVIRATCARGPDGYHVDHAAAQLATVPEPRLVTASEAWQLYGVRAGTVRQWVHRGRLRSHDRNPVGHPLYDAADIQRLARRAQLDP